METNKVTHSNIKFDSIIGKPMTKSEQELREEIACLVEQMGIDGYGTLYIAAAIRYGVEN